MRAVVVLFIERLRRVVEVGVTLEDFLDKERDENTGRSVAKYPSRSLFVTILNAENRGARALDVAGRGARFGLKHVALGFDLAALVLPLKLTAQFSYPLLVAVRRQQSHGGEVHARTDVHLLLVAKVERRQSGVDVSVRHKGVHEGADDDAVLFHTLCYETTPKILHHIDATREFTTDNVSSRRRLRHQRRRVRNFIRMHVGVFDPIHSSQQRAAPIGATSLGAR